MKNMKRLKSVSYLYFAIGLVICLYSLISEKMQTLNISDTFFIVLSKDFAFFVMAIYSVIGLGYIFIQKYIRYSFQLTQFFMFCIPFVYYVFIDFISHNDPNYYLTNPIASKWEELYVPVVLLLSFLASIMVFSGFMIFSTIKMLKKK